jgi:hypothetical protein
MILFTHDLVSNEFYTSYSIIYRASHISFSVIIRYTYIVATRARFVLFTHDRVIHQYYLVKNFDI